MEQMKWWNWIGVIGLAWAVVVIMAEEMFFLDHEKAQLTMHFYFISINVSIILFFIFGLNYERFGG